MFYLPPLSNSPLQMEMMRKFTTNVRSRLTRLCNHDTPASVKPVGYVGDMKQLRTTWLKLTEMLVICEDKTTTMLMSAVYQSPSATLDMRDQIVSVYMPNFSSNACDGELIGSLFPSNLSGKEKKAFANAKKAGATSLMRHMNAASGDSLDKWYSDAQEERELPNALAAGFVWRHQPALLCVLANACQHLRACSCSFSCRAHAGHRKRCENCSQCLDARLPAAGDMQLDLWYVPPLFCFSLSPDLHPPPVCRCVWCHGPQ